MGMGTESGPGAGSDAGGYTSGGVVDSSGGGVIGLIGSILKDPEVLKAVGSTAAKLGTTIQSAQNIPPHAIQMFGRALDQEQQRRSQMDALNPYVGDISRFITPDTAKDLLSRMGIPIGRTSI